MNEKHYKGIIKYVWKCFDLKDGNYQKKEWVYNSHTILENFEPPYVDLESGWYVDLDKNIAYFYTDYKNSKEELENEIKNNHPLNYKVDCFIKYEYSLLKFDSENCNSANYKTLRENMFCICKENTKLKCRDEKDNILIEQLDNCIPNTDGTSIYIKTKGNAIEIN